MCDPQIIIAICALVTSFASILLTILSLYFQKIHNLKMVRPIGFITIGDYENDIYVSIVNNGVGPLLIQKFSVSKPNLSATSLIDIIPSDIDRSVTWTDFASNFIGRALKPGDRLYLIRLKFDDNSSAEDDRIKKNLRDFLKDLEATLTYTDIYEKKIFVTKRSFEFFARDVDGKNICRQKYSGER